MRSPLSAVWLTWRTRPLMYLLPLLLVFLHLGRSSTDTFHDAEVGPGWPNRGVLWDVKNLKKHLESDQTDDSVRLVDFRSMITPSGVSVADPNGPQDDIQNVLLRFPNLEAIRFQVNQIRNMRGDILRELKNVHSVSILTSEVTEQDLEQLALIPNLQHLEIDSTQTVTDLRALGKCRKLYSIDIIQDSIGITQVYAKRDPEAAGEPLRSISSITQLASIPNVRALNISDGPHLGDTPFIYGALTNDQRDKIRTLADQLARSSRLDRIFIGRGRGEGWLETVRILRRQLPHMTVLPSMYTRSRVHFLSIRLWPVVVAIALIVIQAIGQLSGPQSLLVPGYRVKHLQFIGAVYVILLLAGITGAWRAGISLVAASAIILMLTGVAFGLGTDSWNSPPVDNSRSRNRLVRIPVWIRVALMMALFLLPMSAHRASPWVDWFLAGEQPFLALAFTVVGSAMLYASFTRLHQSHRLRSEAGIPPAVTAQEVMKTPQLAAATALNPGYMKLQTRWSHSVANCVRSLRQNTRGMNAFRFHSQLWLLGSILKGMFLMLLVFVMVASSLAVRNVTILSPAAIAKQILEPPGLMMAFQMGAMFIGILLWQRRPMFAAELLRPAARRQWVNTTVGTVWWLTVRFLVLVWLFVLLLRLIAGLPVVDNWTGVELLTVLAAATTSAGLFLWAVALKRVWVVATAVIVLAASSAVTMLLVTGRHLNSPFDGFLTNPAVVCGLAFGALIAGIALIASAQRLWMRLELARED